MRSSLAFHKKDDQTTKRIRQGMDWYQKTKDMVTPFWQGQGFITCSDQQNTNLRELRRQKRDAINKISQEPTAKRQATKDQNESQPTPNEDPQLTTKDRDGNSAVAITVGEVSKTNGDLSMLTGRSTGSLSTLSSSKKEWALHLGLVKTVCGTDIPKKWIKHYKFAFRMLCLLQPICYLIIHNFAFIYMRKKMA